MSVRSPESSEGYLELSRRELHSLSCVETFKPIDLTGFDRVRIYPNKDGGGFVELHCGRNIFFISLQETPLFLQDPLPNPPCQN